MRRVCFVLLSIFIVMETFSQERSTDRQPVAAGRFYAADKVTLSKDISQLFESCIKVPSKLKVRAIISPHAGYVFSGRVAAAAYSAIDRNTTYKNIFIIGSSHIMAFDGASVYNSGDFITPLGKMIVNKEIANKLKNENKLFNFPVTAHLQEHSLEVQIPLIQYYFSNNTMIVPIIIGTNNINSIKKIAEILKPWFTSENLFVISSDFSHYPSYNTAVEVDNSTANSIVTGNPQNFLDVLKKNSSRNAPGLSTSMCGWTSGLLLLYLAEGNDLLEFKRIDYCNSGDSKYGNKDEVVGYNAIELTEKNNKTSTPKNLADEIRFSDEEKDELITIARNNIKSILYDQKRLPVDKETLPEIFKKPLGAFVTLKINGALRGCIGRFISSDPLYEVVLESSQSSAFEDPRFSPLTKEEFSRTEIEITVLGPLKKIDNIKEIVLGRHGIYIKKDFRTGTMLPQVATENGWSVEEFLGYTSRDKAGLGWDGWKNAELFIYEGIVLEEKKK
jgi:AmmeMemoRadiSam system protein B/AmmeMemoRadiSam system protein A